jgi:hypothetical protein
MSTQWEYDLQTASDSPICDEPEEIDEDTEAELRWEEQRNDN